MKNFGKRFSEVTGEDQGPNKYRSFLKELQVDGVKYLRGFNSYKKILFLSKQESSTSPI